MRSLLPFLLFLNLHSISQLQINSYFHPDSIKQLVSALAADSMMGRFSGSIGAVKAANYIAEEFRKSGLLPVSGMNGYFMDVPGYGMNVIAGIQGNDRANEIIIFSAHYDHVGTRHSNIYKHLMYDEAEKGDTIYNGANDDASGVAAIITLAKYYVSMKPLSRTVIFIAFTGEEQGLLGSSYFTDDLSPGPVMAVINLEMLGRASDSKKRPFITGHELSSLMAIMNDRLKKNDEKSYGKKFFRPDPFELQDLFRRSDNYPFARLGIPAHTIMLTGANDKYYHSLNDELVTLDFELMGQVIKAVAIACEGMVKGLETPSRLRQNQY